MDIKTIDLAQVSDAGLENVIDQGIRHKAGTSHIDYLRAFLRISRPLGYATHDESWGEFEKEFTIIVRRMIMAERRLKSLEGESLE